MRLKLVILLSLMNKIKIYTCFMILIFIMIGCKTGTKFIVAPDWTDFENQFDIKDVDVDDDNIVILDLKEQFPDTKITLIGLQLSWSSAVRDICSQAELSVVIPADYGGILCDLQLMEVPVYDSLNLLCNLADDVSFSLKGNTVVFSENTVQSVGTVDPKFAEISNLTNVIQSVLSSDSTVNSVNGMIVIGGSELSVKQSKLIADLVGTRQPNAWFVDVAILSMSENWQIDFGISGSIGGIIKKVSTEKGILDYVLDGTWSVDYGKGIDQILLRTGVVILEGTESEIQSVEEIPIPQRTVSPEGTVTITGYETIRAGIMLTISATAVPNGIKVKLTPEISDITGFVDEKPIVSRKKITTNLIVKENDKIILSGVWSDRVSRKFGSLLHFDASESVTEWLVCARFRKLTY